LWFHFPLGRVGQPLSSGSIMAIFTRISIEWLFVDNYIVSFNLGNLS
jgi:hypothetical protein